MRQRNWRYIQSITLFVFSCLLITSSLRAEDLSVSGSVDRELITQEQRQQALQEELNASSPDVRLLSDGLKPGLIPFPVETPCFDIKELTLQGVEYFEDIDIKLFADLTQGQCLGNQGVSLLMREIQNSLIGAGFITSRVLVPSQDLSTGELTLQLVPGVISAKQTEGRINLMTALPGSEGELLDLRDIEQGLENLQRLPTVNADIQIEPGVKPGESDLVVNWQQEKNWRVAISADDSGSRSTGRNQGQVTLFLDNPLALSDLFYISKGSDIQSNNALGTSSYTVHYSFPINYWMLGFTANGYDYDQTVAGLNQDIKFSGTSRTRTLDISRVIRRTATSKTSIQAGLTYRDSRNFINDAEVEVQRRDTTFWELGVKHRHYFNQTILDASIDYRKGVRWLGAQPAPEEFTDTGTALSTIYVSEFDLQLPFIMEGQSFRYRGRFKRQWSDTRLTAQDRFSIAGRYTVRGFDGQSTLTADKGWFVRNDIGWRIPSTNHELYFGLDYGEVSGNDSEFLIGKHLAGGVIGARGNFQGVSYDLFAGRSISKPSGFRAEHPTYGFNFHWEF